MSRKDSSPASTLYDSARGYGWISICLHWTAAVLVVALWFLGKRVGFSPMDEFDARRALHVSVAASAWLLLVFRIGWRMRAGHPYLPGQSPATHRVAMSAHYAMLAAALLMLLSGPLIVWAGGDAIQVFGFFSVPGPFGQSDAVRDAARLVHESTATVLAVLFVLHVLGALKHLMFHADETIVRMLWPARRDRQA